MQQAANTKPPFKWKPDWRTTVFTLVFCPLFVGLGFWQQHRAVEKEAIEASWEQRRLEVPRPLSELRGTEEQLAYRRVLLDGSFIAGRDFLLDNRINQGRYGMEVLSPMRLAGSDRVVLVNRGWLAADPARRSLPDIPDLHGPLSLVGTIYVPPGREVLLAPEQESKAWPRLFQTLDVPRMAGELDEMLYPYSIRLEANSPAALLAEWPLINMSADKHRAYSLQWFSMAVALLLFYLAYSSNLLNRWQRARDIQS